MVILSPKFSKNGEKKVVRNILKILKFFNFFEFFTKSVLQTLLRGRETTRKKYQELFEKSAKNVVFSTHRRPVTRHPQPVKIKKSTNQKTSILEAVFESQKTFSSRDIKQKEIKWDPLGEHLKVFLPPGDKAY